MRRVATLLLVLVCGCSTHPLADVLDTVSPGRLPPAPRYFGGAGVPTPTTAPAPPPADRTPDFGTRVP